MLLPTPILLIDQNKSFSLDLVEQLNFNHEFSVTAAENSIDGLNLAKAGKFKAILLVLNLDDSNPHEFYDQVRSSGVKIPIIMICDSGDVLVGNKYSEDLSLDYLNKPIKLSVLVSRLRTNLWNYNRSEEGILIIGPYSFDPNSKVLINLSSEKRIRLTEKESSIIKYLFLSNSRVVKRETLLSEVWGYNSGVTTHTLETHIYRLRQKIEKDPSSAEILITDVGGYRLEV